MGNITASTKHLTSEQPDEPSPETPRTFAVPGSPYALRDHKWIDFDGSVVSDARTFQWDTFLDTIVECGFTLSEEGSNEFINLHDLGSKLILNYGKSPTMILRKRATSSVKSMNLLDACNPLVWVHHYKDYSEVVTGYNPTTWGRFMYCTLNRDNVVVFEVDYEYCLLIDTDAACESLRRFLTE